MLGSCFCGEIQFEINNVKPKLYQCHCSMCRKVTSSSFNTAFIIHHEKFRWLNGESNIKSYSKPSGYRVDFCENCGSTVPNVFGDSQVWVPAGLINDDLDLKISNHLCVSSKASWDNIADDANQYNEVPDLSLISS